MLIWRADSLEKILMLRKIEGRRRRRWERMKCLNGITDSMDMSLSKLWEMVKDRDAWHATVHGVAKWWTCLSDWTMHPYFPYGIIYYKDIETCDIYTCIYTYIYIYMCILTYTCTHKHMHTHDGILLSHKKGWNNVICKQHGGTLTVLYQMK